MFTAKQKWVQELRYLLHYVKNIVVSHEPLTVQRRSILSIYRCSPVLKRKSHFARNIHSQRTGSISNDKNLHSLRTKQEEKGK